MVFIVSTRRTTSNTINRCPSCRRCVPLRRTKFRLSDSISLTSRETLHSPPSTVALANQSPRRSVSPFHSKPRYFKPGFHYPSWRQSWRVTGFHYPSTQAVNTAHGPPTRLVETGLYWLCDLELFNFSTTKSYHFYDIPRLPTRITCTNFEHFESFHFLVMIWTNKQTKT